MTSLLANHRSFFRPPAWPGAFLLGLLMNVACSGHSFNTAAGATSGSAGMGGSPTTNSTTGGGAGGMGAGGAGGGTGAHGPPATAMVSAGNRASTTKYVMVQTLGQSTQNQSKSTSKKYVMQGGLIGANGSLP